MCCWSLRLSLVSLLLASFVLPLFSVVVENDVLGNGGSGIISSPNEEVDERADWVRLKNREESTSEECEDERVVVLGRGPVVVEG